MTADPHPRAVLAVRVDDETYPTVRDLLVGLLRVTWKCSEGDSWDASAYDALVEAGMVDDGDHEAANELIKSAIDALGRG